MKHASDSLAGRMAIVELSPFLRSEIPGSKTINHWVFGGYLDGGILKKEAFPFWQKNYLDLLAERDLPTWGLPAKPQVIKKLFQILAHLHGQIWNASEIGGNLGLSYHTINSYIDFLEGSFLIRRLHPYHSNIKKRLVKTPKVYWRDSGLLHFLLQFPNPKGKSIENSLFDFPWVGRSFEGYIIEQILSELQSIGILYNAYFFRTSDGKEIDLILEMNGKKIGIEIKTTSNPSMDFVENLKSIANLISMDRCFLLTKSNQKLVTENFVMGNLDLVLGELMR